MNPIIEKLLLQIAYVCLHITTQGKWHAHYTLAAHTRAVQVEILSANTDYLADKRQQRAFSRRVYYQNTPGYIQYDEAELATRAITELTELLNDLDPFLSIEQLAAEPVAAPPEARPIHTTLSDDSLAAINRLALEGGIAELQLSTGPLDHSALLTVDRIDQPAGYGLEATLAVHKQRHTLSLSTTDGIYAARLCEWVETIAHGRLAAAA